MHILLRKVLSHGRRRVLLLLLAHNNTARRSISINSISMNCITYARDRALDQTVEKERHLRAVYNLKSLIKSEPSKSLPLSSISQQKLCLGIPLRPIDFIRRYPFVFEEFTLTPTSTDPHLRLSPYAVDLDQEEQQIYGRDSFLKDAADRLLRLLMLSRVNRLPIPAVDNVTWDLGLPRDYLTTLVSKFPDYFRVVGGGEFIELVCWSKDLSVSVMEKKRVTEETPLAFTLQNSRGFHCDNKYSEWLQRWEGLPYFSPYERAPPHAPSSSDECDRWATAVMHELLHILCSKKMEREGLLLLGKHLGLRWKFNRALVYHPGIFYLSCRNNQETVILREAFRREVLLEKHPLMDMRCRYTYLMNRVMEGPTNKKPRHRDRHPTPDSPQCDHSSKGRHSEMGECHDFGKGVDSKERSYSSTSSSNSCAGRLKRERSSRGGFYKKSSGRTGDSERGECEDSCTGVRSKEPTRSGSGGGGEGRLKRERSSRGGFYKGSRGRTGDSERGECEDFGRGVRSKERIRSGSSGGGGGEERLKRERSSRPRGGFYKGSRGRTDDSERGECEDFGRGVRSKEPTRSSDGGGEGRLKRERSSRGGFYKGSRGRTGDSEKGECEDFGRGVRSKERIRSSGGGGGEGRLKRERSSRGGFYKGRERVCRGGMADLNEGHNGNVKRGARFRMGSERVESHVGRRRSMRM